MREAKINVNRIVAYNYKFPICMSISTFITIQIQKIFSIFNCPNSEFTWKIFQRYIRELILESWSLMINELDQDFANKEKDEINEKELINRMTNLYKILDVYLPQYTDKDRRTLAGCEFGFCVNNGLINNDTQFMEKNPYCIVEKDPLLVFTIFVKSTTTVIAIILISLAIYLGIIGKRITDWFIFPQNAGKALKKTASIVINAFEENVSKFIFGEIIKFLEKNLNKNIKEIELYDEGSAEIIRKLKDIFDSKEANKINKKFSDNLKSYFEVKTNWSEHINNFMDFESIMKISVYILLLSASFIMNYRHNKKALVNYETESADYNNNNRDDENQAINKIEEIRNNHENEYPVDEMTKISSDLGQSIDKSYDKKRNTFQLKMAITNILEFAVKSTSFIIDKKSLIENGFQTLQSCSNPLQNKKLLRVCYKGLKNVFLQQVKLYSLIQYPSIIKFVGYEIEKHKQYIFIDSKEKGILSDCIFNTKMHLNLTNKLIIAYGISCAMEYLHQN